MLPLAKDRNVAPALCLRNRFSNLEHEEPGNMELGSSEHGNLEARNMEPGNPKHGNLEPGNTMVEPGTLEAEVSNLDLVSQSPIYDSPGATIYSCTCYNSLSPSPVLAVLLVYIRQS